LVEGLKKQELSLKDKMKKRLEEMNEEMHHKLQQA